VEQHKNIKNNPFKVPENYFEELPGRIQERINTRQLVPERSMRTVIFNPRVLAAASFVLVLGLASLFIFQLKDNTNDLVDPLAQEEFSTISEYLLTDIDDTELMKVYVEMTELSNNGLLISTENPDEQEVIDYLLEDDMIEYYLLDEL